MGGVLDGVRIIGRKTLQLMASDHLGPEVKLNGHLEALPGPQLWPRLCTSAPMRGWAPFAAGVGQYFGAGIAGTFFWIDPREELFAILMAQGPGQREYLRTLLRSLVYAAVE